MRTTIRLPDDLMREVKRMAVEGNRTLTQVIEDALRETVRRASDGASHREPFRMMTFRGTGLAPGLSLDHMADLLDVLDEEQ